MGCIIFASFKRLLEANGRLKTDFLYKTENLFSGVLAFGERENSLDDASGTHPTPILIWAKRLCQIGFILVLIVDIKPIEM
jgi:hypothetical protein